ncbi:MAG: hypothetical protein LBH54_05490, partial [Clostridiales bacterium]|nr:hypothetical protein [Clostridiales bacterium]
MNCLKKVLCVTLCAMTLGIPAALGGDADETSFFQVTVSIETVDGTQKQYLTAAGTLPSARRKELVTAQLLNAS